MRSELIFSSGTGEKANKIHNGKSFIMGSVLFKRKMNSSTANVVVNGVPTATDKTVIETDTPFFFFLPNDEMSD